MTDLKMSDIQPFLSGVDWPASKAELVQCATERGAKDELRLQLNQLPEMTYESSLDVQHALDHQST